MTWRDFFLDKSKSGIYSNDINYFSFSNYTGNWWCKYSFNIMKCIFAKSEPNTEDFL